MLLSGEMTNEKIGPRPNRHKRWQETTFLQSLFYNFAGAVCLFNELPQARAGFKVEYRPLGVIRFKVLFDELRLGSLAGPRCAVKNNRLR